VAVLAGFARNFLKPFSGWTPSLRLGNYSRRLLIYAQKPA